MLHRRGSTGRSLMLAAACFTGALAGRSALAQQNPFDPSAFPRSAPVPGPVPWFRTPTAPALPTPNVLLYTAFPAGLDEQFGAPPDPSAACGPRGVLCIDNYHVIYSRKGGGGGEGNVYYDLARQYFFGSAHPNDSYVDPRVVFDPHSGRFFVITLEVPLHTCSATPPSSSYRSYLRVSVSASDHPREPGDWLHYSFDVTRVEESGGTTRHYAPDYPAIGVDATCLTVSANYFEMPLPCRGQRGVGVITLSKAALLAGTATPLITYAEGNGPFALSPVSDLWGAGNGSITYLVEWPLGITNSLRLWALTDPLGARTLQSTTMVIPDHGFAHPNMGAPQCPPASGPPTSLRSWSGTAQGIAQWADGSIWFCGTGTALGTGGELDRMRVHFYRVAPNSYPAAPPSLQEAGVLDAGEGVWNFSPSIGVTPNGDVGVVFTQSSPTQCPRMMATLRGAGAAAFPEPIVVATSPEAYANYDASIGLMRWGDYAAVSVDPVDHSIWVTHMVGGPGQTWPQTPGTGYPPLNQHILGNLVFEDLASGWPQPGRLVRGGQTAVQGLSAASDGAGGVFALWKDKRLVQLGERMQHLTPAGAIAPGWLTNGILAGRSINALAGTVVADGAGGAYHVRVDPTLGLVADRVQGDGQRSPGWPANQVQVASGVSSYRVASDAAAGVLVAYAAAASGGTRVQKVSGAGSIAWAPPLLSSSTSQPEICPDQAGGAFVSWTAAGHVLVKHVLASGAIDPAWPGSGIDLGTSTGSRLVPDGTGGVFIVYSALVDLHAVRLDATGTVVAGWAGGRDVAVAPGNQIEQVVAADGAGGLLVAWGDTRDGAIAGEDIYVTRLGPDGEPAPGWPAQGRRVSGAVGAQRRPALAADGAGGAWIAWTDGRADPECFGAGCGEDVYWSHVTAAGTVESGLTADGAVVSDAPGDQGDAVIVGATGGSAIVTWLDGTLAPDGDPAWFTRVLAARLEAGVTDVGDRPVLVEGLSRPEPNPAVASTSLHVDLEGDHPGGQLRVTVFDIAGRVVRALHAGPAIAGRTPITWDLRSAAGARVRPGLYFVHVASPAGTFSRGVVVR